MTLEEARAARNLADRLSALLAVSSALARSRERELAATTRADRIDDERQRLEHIIATEAGRNRVLPEMANRQLRAAAHGPQARTTLEQLERIGRSNGPLILSTELGIDPTGWAAVAHLASPRRDGPFVLLDGASSVEHELLRWQTQENSPLLLADGGTLVVFELAALPLEVQEAMVQTLSRRSANAVSSNVFPLSLVAVLQQPPEQLVESGKLDKSLRRWLGDTVVSIPPLRERSEDLRSLVLGRLTRLGLRLRGEPMGVEPGALRQLTEHTWPGNEAELDGVLTLAAQKSAGQALTARDLALIGFRPDIVVPPLVTPMPAPSRRHRRRPV
jgi:DNA-binding NtrC family response regulator